jgi:hypothetical protein
MSSDSDAGSDTRDPEGLTVEDRLPAETISALFDACAPEGNHAD